jgi:hypothetical protein
VEVYWFTDEVFGGGVRLPESWQVQYSDGRRWLPVTGPSGFGLEADRFNRVTFNPLRTSALRIVVSMQPGYSAGILEWQVLPANR